MRNVDLTPDQQAELAALAAMSDADIDTSDIPEIIEFSNPRRGVFPASPNVKLDPEPAGHPERDSRNDGRATNTTERGLEDRIVRLLTDGRGDAASAGEISERPAVYSAGWMAGDPADYDRGNCVDLKQLSAFLGSAKTFARLYAFLSQALPYANPEWEKLSILLNFLIPKLPAPADEDLSKGILETVNMDSYRAEKQAAQRLSLDDEDAENRAGAHG